MEEFWNLHCFFHSASCKGHLKQLQSAFAKSNFQCLTFTSSFFPFHALELACAFGSEEAVRELLGQGGHSSSVLLSSLRWAIVFGEWEICKLLLPQMHLASSSQIHLSSSSASSQLAEFLLWNGTPNDKCQRILGIMRKNDKFSAVTARANEIIANSGEKTFDFVGLERMNFIKINLSSTTDIQMHQFIPMTQACRRMLSEKFISQASIADLYCFKHKDHESTVGAFTLPLVGNFLILGARYESFLAYDAFCTFVQAGVRELACKQDACENVSDAVFWFSNVVQIVLWLHQERALRIDEWFRVEILHFLSVQWWKLIEMICTNARTLIQRSLLDFKGGKSELQTVEKRHEAFKHKNRQSLPFGLGKIVGKLQMWNAKPLEKDEFSSPEALVSFLKEIWSIACLHFNPLKGNGNSHSRISLCILKEVLAFCSSSALQLILSDVSCGKNEEGISWCYCNPTYGLSIRMNVAEVEFWLQETFLEAPANANGKDFFFLQQALSPLISLCQYLQIYFTGEDFVEFCEKHEMPSELLQQVRQKFAIQPQLKLQVEDFVDLGERFVVTGDLHSLFYKEK